MDISKQNQVKQDAVAGAVSWADVNEITEYTMYDVHFNFRMTTSERRAMINEINRIIQNKDGHRFMEKGWSFNRITGCFSHPSGKRVEPRPYCHWVAVDADGSIMTKVHLYLNSALVCAHY